MITWTSHARNYCNIKYRYKNSAVSWATVTIAHQRKKSWNLIINLHLLPAHINKTQFLKLHKIPKRRTSSIVLKSLPTTLKIIIIMAKVTSKSFLLIAVLMLLGLFGGVSARLSGRDLSSKSKSDKSYSSSSKSDKSYSSSSKSDKSYYSSSKSDKSYSSSSKSDKSYHSKHSKKSYHSKHSKKRRLSGRDLSSKSKSDKSYSSSSKSDKSYSSSSKSDKSYSSSSKSDKSYSSSSKSDKSYHSKHSKKSYHSKHSKKSYKSH
jgi:hypothetical protein